MAEHAPHREIALDPPPARQTWEEPPAAGWSSHLSGMGLETLGLVGVALLGVSTLRIVDLANRFGAEPQDRTAHAVGGLLWALVCLLWAAAAVYLARRLGGFSLVLAMLTDHGRVARLGGRPPVWLDAPPASGLVLSHLSDLHVTLTQVIDADPSLLPEVMPDNLAAQAEARKLLR